MSCPDEPAAPEEKPMRAVMCEVPQWLLDPRRKTGADRWDEMWEGVLHMAPSPNGDHQELEGQIEFELRRMWLPVSGGRVLHQMNVMRPGRWPDDYRIPDLVLLLPERDDRYRNQFIEGGPDVVVEIKSPGDETYAKIPFYAEIGVRELWVVDLDTKAVEVHVLEGAAPFLVPADPEGWIASAATGLELRGSEGGSAGRVEMRWASRS
jgi:Uma2 family endonuclease